MTSLRAGVGRAANLVRDLVDGLREVSSLAPNGVRMSENASVTPTPGRFNLRRFDASEQVALEIRRYLEHHNLQPGDRLGTEAQLAAEFGVSRPTLREALRLLASSHLIRATQGRNGGIYVIHTPNEGMGSSLSESIATMLAAETVSLDQLLEARMFLEVPLAGMAARNVSDDLVRELEQAIAGACGQRPTSAAFSSTDADFHRAIARASGNELLVALTSWTLDVLEPSIVEKVGPSVDSNDIVDQHRAILDAIARAHRPSAERAMRAHITYVRERASAALAASSEDAPGDRQALAQRVAI